MRISKRTLIMAVSLMLALTVTALGTVAYMTANDTVVNKFTVGNINIIVDEENVDGIPGPDGVITPARDQENEYKLIPGLEQPKDPRMIVKAPSEECYVRMIVKMNCYDVLKAETGLADEALLIKLVGKIGDGWMLHESPAVDATGTQVSYEYRYKEAVNAATADVPLAELFKTITIPITFDQDELKNQMSDFYLNVTGEAVQTASFEEGGADAAWAAYDAQMSPAAGGDANMLAESDDTPATVETDDINNDTATDTGDEAASGEGGENDPIVPENEGDETAGA